MLGSVSVSGAEQVPHALPRPRRPRNPKRTLARPLINILQQEEGQAAEMVAVEVADEDRVDVGRVNSVALQRRQRGCSAVQQK